ncbi:transposase family protein [Methylobacterium goesingense]|uniref:Transposase n=1 Tax=Methylobacterium goesingense TaxID=243690 RepID=A0ABV2LBR0_9HYPH|nr:transposase family protein [Methylobacterium goesingense]GJD75386.1 hypothetical protein CFIICLFH_3627 [Methylobacterium goesingense]
MATKVRHKLQEEWHFTGEGAFLLTRFLPEDRLLLEGVTGQREKILSEDGLNVLREDGEAVRIRRTTDNAGHRGRYDEVDEVGPDGASDMARARRFYCRQYDQRPCSLGTKGLEAFIERNRVAAAARGIAWVPSGPALYRAITKRGERHVRPMRAMESQTGKGKRERWPKAVSSMLERAVAWYYSLRSRDRTDAYAFLTRFIKRANGIGRVRHGGAWQTLRAPHYEVLRTRIAEAENEETIAAKHDATVARRRFRGTRTTIQAKGILDFVLIDSTVIDGWCVLDDFADGTIPAGRPTLTVALDLYSRTPLAMLLTYEPPSIYTIMSCVLLLTTSKRDLIARFPQYADLWADKWGKPDTIIVDNALEQIGVSFQDACEDAGISVRWAPVKNPEYKAPVERIFHTFNVKLFHKVPGAVHLPPHLMSRLGFDPAKDAVISRSEVEGLIYQTLRDSYQYERHAGIKAAPETLWRAGLANGREVVDDPKLLEASFGKVGEALLTREGIRFEGMRFHDPVVTTRLLSQLAYLAPVRGRRKGSATVKVKIKYNPADVGSISVWNPEKEPRKGYDSLPNTDARYTAGGLGMWHHRRIEEWAKAEGLAFSTDDERWEARNRLRVSIENAAPHIKYAAMRRKRRLLDPPKPVLVGDTVEFATVGPGVLGSKVANIPTAPLAEVREGDGIPEKGPRRGGRKADATRARNRRRKQAEAAAENDARTERASADKAAAAPAEAGLSPDAADAYFADMARRMDTRKKRRTTGDE